MIIRNVEHYFDVMKPAYEFSCYDSGPTTEVVKR